MALYSMKEAIDKMLEQSHWKYRYQVSRLKTDWPELVGVTAARHTREIDIRNHTLFIYTDVAALKHEFKISKDVLRTKINTHLGEAFIQEIIIA